ncbi:peptidoglycan editing factor PgeF [Aliihoeflea aestuarii]|jgi:polyphenol oxidase|uniref:peptidoglycan editing factor PgeF n=1 Tax=Aliihoeflea aestuarii TaxID=453840 RepID=UPI00209598CF|nr:peptidoglycan editing factor PgeF [Aliihoeflea aestuarii]MCO6393200.1 peptidoglycan editing factor PgeF [Aliihoeflea aestuarii]
MLDSTRPDPVRSDLMDELAPNGIRHGFFTRRGGVSQGIYAGLNVGYGSSDDREAVKENRSRAARWLNVSDDRLATVHQVHSADVEIVDAALPVDERPKADALVTATPGLAIAILTADCGPILFADGQARVIGAAHAGWKGALHGIAENTVAAMESLGAKRENIHAVLGPAISAANYEVGPEFIVRFIEADLANDVYFKSSGKDGHALFDLNRYTLDRLARAGVAVDHAARCTYAEPDNFYSYRRTTHRQEPDYGRQLSAIVLET